MFETQKVRRHDKLPAKFCEGLSSTEFHEPFTGSDTEEAEAAGFRKRRSFSVQILALRQIEEQSNE